MNAIVPEITSGSHTRSLQPQHREPTSHTVRRGQNLSSIIRDFLESTGQDHSAARIYKEVVAVAKSNSLANPDRIRIGQIINLEILAPQPETFARAIERITPTKQDPNPSQPMAAVTPSHPYHRVLEGPARLTSTFGMRPDPIEHDHRHHNGIDLAATRNTPITPMRPGVVTFSGWMRGYGNTIIVKHEGGISTQYSHAGKRLVKEGMQVDASTVVGLVGSTGRATGPHLHFEVKHDGRQVNPIPYLMTEPKQIPRTRLSLSI